MRVRLLSMRTETPEGGVVVGGKAHVGTGTVEELYGATNRVPQIVVRSACLRMRTHIPNLIRCKGWLGATKHVFGLSTNIDLSAIPGWLFRPPIRRTT